MGERDDLGELKRLAHEVRNAMNGVAVSLEVARSRAARGASPADVHPFLETASQQLEAATRLQKAYTDLATRIAATAAGAGPRRAATHDAAEA